ncbi:MFS transporter [Nesterenkonia sp. NBAIMH1]|uniref:MFS transporter n=1 Tax=Nesterenkonia sp. NBAIMH1 TaxID=2600320 RepID=UPI0011B43048|nr:MFS transporter [Nesterenkonia sp. NBAIMH1]
MVDDTSKGQGAPQPKDPEPKPRLFTRDFLFATLINLLITTTFFTLVTGMAVYAAAEFSAGETAAGFAASAFVVGALGARVFAGKYVNTLGRKRVMITCLAVFTLATVAYLGVDSYELLITVRIVHGIALGFAQTALTASVFDIIPKSRRGEGSGYYLLANALPPALGPLLSLQLSERYGFDAMFWVVSALSALAFALAVVMRIPEIRRPGTGWWAALSLRPSDIIEPRIFPVALVAMLLGLTFASVMTFLNGYARELGMLDAASVYFLLYSGGMLITRLFTGRIQDRYGDNSVIYPALCLFVASMALTAWAPGSWALYVGGVLAGGGFGTMLPALQAVIANALPTHRISIGVSTFFICMDVGFGFAPLMLGPVVEAMGYQFMYAACAAVIALNLVLYWLVHGRYRVRQGVHGRGPLAGQRRPETGIMPSVDPRR